MVRNRICRMFEERLGLWLERDPSAIADAVSQHFQPQAKRLRDVFGRLAGIPGQADPPKALVKLKDALAKCVARCRETRPTVLAVKKHLNALNDGFKKLNIFDTELNESAVEAVRTAASVRDHHVIQLTQVEALVADHEAAALRIYEHLTRERPWDGIGILDRDLALLREAYSAERGRLLALQG